MHPPRPVLFCVSDTMADVEMAEVRAEDDEELAQATGLAASSAIAPAGGARLPRKDPALLICTQALPISPAAQSTRAELALHAAKVNEFELKRKMRAMVVPTEDAKVRTMLRQLGEPITLFGEREVRAASLACMQPCGCHIRKRRLTARRIHKRAGRAPGPPAQVPGSAGR